MTHSLLRSMAAKSRAVKSIFDGLGMSPRSNQTQPLMNVARQTAHQHICASCRDTIPKSRYVSTATAQVTEPAPPISQLSPDEPAVAPGAQSRILVKAGVVVSRPPLTTPDPHPFDTAFYLYQRRLNERLVLPFTQYFHYKRGTPAFEHWRAKRRERGGVAARDVGKYNAYTAESWNDEVLVGDDTGTPSRIVEQLIEEEGRQAEFAGDSGNLKLAGLKRRTAADEKEDTKSLERSLSRTLYLLVRNKSSDQGTEAKWQFPSGTLEHKEGLKDVSQHAGDLCIILTCGAGSSTCSEPILRAEHEYMVCSRASGRALCAQDRRSGRSDREEDRTEYAVERGGDGEDVLHEGQDIRWSSGRQEQSAQRARVQVAHQGGD